MNINEQAGKYTSPAEVRLIRTLPGPIERVWDYLTDSEKRARWFGGGPMEQRAGGTYQITFRHKNIAPHETPPENHKEHHDPGVTMGGKVIRCERPRLLTLTFGDEQESEVTFELTPEGKNVLLVLTHRATGGDLPYMAGYGAGWHTHLAHLLAVLEDKPRPPFWPMHAQLRPEYEKMRLAAQGA